MTTSDSTDSSELPPPRPRWLISLLLTLTVAGLIYLAEKFELLPESQSAANRSQSMLVADGQVWDHHVEISQTTIVEPETIPAVKLVGNWVLDDGIRRVIRMNPDGTAIMKVEFDFLTSFRYGSELVLELEWSVDDNILTQTIVGGTPESGRNTLISDFGNAASYQILKLTDEQLFLEETSPRPDAYTWTRTDQEPL